MARELLFLGDKLIHNCLEMADSLSKLHDYEKTLIAEEVNGYSEKYKQSKFYQEPTISEVLGDYYPYFQELLTALEGIDKQEIQNLVVKFEDLAKEKGSSWYDEDLTCERSGYEWETQFFTNLRNIAATAVEKDEARFEDFYEDYGRV